MKESGRGSGNGSVLHVAAGREWRGGERQVLLLLDALNRRGVAQTLVTARGSELARRVREAGVNTVEVSWSAGLDPRAWWALRGLIQRYGPPLIHAHDGHALRLASWASGASATTNAPPHRLIATRRVTFPLRRPAAWKQLSAVIAISEAVRVSLVEAGLDPARVHVVPSAISLSSVSQVTDAEIRTAFGWTREAPVALNVAALTAEKGHTLLLDAATLLRDRRPALRWLIAGDGPLRAPLDAEVTRRGLQNVVRLVGHVREVERWIRSATVLVSSSTAEGFGSTLLDALALGTPIVATAVGGVPEVLEGDAGKLVPPGDAAALAAAIDGLLSNPSAISQQVARGREVVRRFDINPVAERTLEVYRSVGLEVG